MRRANDEYATAWYGRRVRHSRPKRYTNWYLADWMRTLAVSQTQLVERTDLSKATVSLLFNDRQDYTPEIVRDVASALNIAPFELLMRPEDAMALRRLRREAIDVVEASRMFAPEQQDQRRTGTEG